MDKLSDGRRPISTERAGAGGSDPIKAAGDERNGSPGDREPWKAQASSPAVPFNKAVDHGRGTRDGARVKGQPVKRLGKKRRFADTLWQRSLSMARTTAWPRK